MMNPNCWFGDHDWLGNGWCKHCDHFNGGLLSYMRYEKAIREDRAHFGHFHRTLEAKQRCTRGPDTEWTEDYGDSEVES